MTRAKSNKVCKVSDCSKKASALGLCQSHYYRLKKYGDPEYIYKRVQNLGETCKLAGCKSSSYVKGYCKKHYARFRKHGDANTTIGSPKGVFVGCKVEGCTGKHSSKGYCKIHYPSFKKYGDPLVRKQGKKGLYKNCTVEGCNREHEGKGYCSMHLSRYRKYGTPTPDIKFPTPKGENLSDGQQKKCADCGKKKPISEFHVSNSRPDKLSIYCKQCSTIQSRNRYSDPQKRERILERGKKWRDKNPESDVRKHLRRKYGMSLEQYNFLFEKQNGVCALCGKPESTKRMSKSNGPERLAVDHCHDTGRIRGLLCFKCNTAVGSIGDDEASAKRVVEYLASYAIDPKSKD